MIKNDRTRKTFSRRNYPKTTGSVAAAAAIITDGMTVLIKETKAAGEKARS